MAELEFNLVAVQTQTSLLQCRPPHLPAACRYAMNIKSLHSHPRRRRGFDSLTNGRRGTCKFEELLETVLSHSHAFSQMQFIWTEQPVPLFFSWNLWVCSQAAQSLAFFRVLRSPWGSLKFLLPPCVGTNLSRAVQSNPPRSSPVVHILSAGLGHRAASGLRGSAITCGAKPETRERANKEEELHMRRRSCEGQVPSALLPVIHQIRDSVSHKSPRPLS